MKKILIFTAIWLIGSSFIANAQIDPNKEYFKEVKWTSKNVSDPIVIQNGTGAALMIQIVVENSGAPNTAGISIRNCGTTTHIAPGSTAICVTSDAQNPVTFNSDNGTYAATGTYQIKQP